MRRATFYTTYSDWPNGNARPGGYEGRKGKAMNRFEQRYHWTADILAWGHGRYTEEDLKELPMPALFEIHNQVYFQRILEVQTIHS